MCTFVLFSKEGGGGKEIFVEYKHTNKMVHDDYFMALWCPNADIGTWLLWQEIFAFQK